jgi:hypothetical protein
MLGGIPVPPTSLLNARLASPEGRGRRFCLNRYTTIKLQFNTLRANENKNYQGVSTQDRTRYLL